MFKMTGLKLEKIAKIDMYLCIEKGLRGGTSYIARRYAKASKKYMKNYDPTKPSICISYVDINNLHGSAMSSYLPYGGFKWLKNVDNFDVNSVSEKSPVRYILEVDLKYPDELHVLRNDYSLAPEKLAILYDMLSNYYGDVMKLVQNLGDKTNYVLHYRDLQLYLSLGMKLTKIHRVLRFKKSNWMKECIDFNTKERMNAANSFEKDFFKLMINSVYGKTMENLQKRINVSLVNNEKDFLKYTSRPIHITHNIFAKNYAANHEIKPILMLKKPIYVGFAALELSKWLTYDFHYNFVKNILMLNCCLLAESLTYEIKSEDVYEEFFQAQTFV